MMRSALALAAAAIFKLENGTLKHRDGARVRRSTWTRSR